MSRLPIRLRLTAAFALAMLAVLAAAGLFVYLEVRESLDESVAEALEARAGAVQESPDDLPAVAEPEEGFAQTVDRSGRLLDTTGGAQASALDGARLGQASDGEILFEADVPGIEGTARVLARPAFEAAGSPIVVVGHSLEDRDETLAGLLTTFAVGGPVAVAVTSLLGWLLASAGLAPVEAMRRRATAVSLEGDDTLPLPGADDEIRRLGETLNEMLGRLRASFERERRFVADAGHELRTPLAVLKTEVEAALRDGSYGPEVGASLRAALEECDRLAQLADDLLVLARSGESGLPIRPEPVPAGRLLEGVRARFAERARQRGRQISVDAADGVTLHADPLRLGQALGNLVDNALRHGEGDIRLAGRRIDGAVELEVADAGAGIPAELGARAFDRFTRADTARTRGGAGLGLAIVREIARAHGGEAVIGRAATVRIRLPAAR